MKTTFLITTALCCAAGCGGDSKTRTLPIEQLGVSIKAPSSEHDIDVVHEGDLTTKEGELRRVDVTVPGLRMCRISIYPKGEEMTFAERVESAELQLFGTERALTRWHKKTETGDGWALDYEVSENGRPMRVVSHRRAVGGKTYTCESGRIVVDEQAERCAEIVSAACDSLETTGT